MGTHNIIVVYKVLYKELDKKYTGCNLKTTKLLDCPLIGVCAVIKSNTVGSINVTGGQQKPTLVCTTVYIAPHKLLFFLSKKFSIFLISPQNHM